MRYDIVDNPAASQVELHLDGDVAGVAQYSRKDGRMAVSHVEIRPSWQGKGLGSALARGVLDLARDNGWKLLPNCPFLRDYVAGHLEYLDLVPTDQRSRFKLPGAESGVTGSD